MSFVSIQFAFFLPIVFALYWLLGRCRNLRWQNLLVVVASYVFYGWWDWHFLLLIAFTTLCSWLSGLAVEHTRRKHSEQGSSDHSRLVVAINIVLNLAILGLFKYYDFFIESFCSLFPLLSGDRLLLHLILPVGISFYTFQALSYSIDTYRKKLEPTHDAVAFFAYVSFFPQLVAGPIERATNLLPQFLGRRTFN